jgi:5-methylcytosine-specific restriction protein A
MPWKTGSRERLYGWRRYAPHAVKFEERPSARWPGYRTNRWTKESLAFRQANPLCAECKRQGRTVGSEVTDHIIPAIICRDPWDRSNWQPLCKRCNLSKSSSDRKMIEEWRQKNYKHP